MQVVQLASTGLRFFLAVTCRIRHRLLLWLCRQFSDQPVLRIADGVWGACVDVTLPAKTLAAAVTLRKSFAQSFHRRPYRLCVPVISQALQSIQRLLHQFSVSHVFFSCMS
jgi:hypothetical protein